MKYLFLLGVVSITQAAPDKWNYKMNGEDWAELRDISDNECGGKNQSPINLVTGLDNVVNSKDD
jgi:carbonic anhydrase